MTSVIMPGGFRFYLEEVLIVVSIEDFRFDVVCSIVNYGYVKEPHSIIILKDNSAYLSKLSQSSVISLLRNQKNNF